MRPVVTYPSSMTSGFPIPYIGVSTNLQAFAVVNTPMRRQDEAGVFDEFVRSRSNVVMHFMDETASAIPSSLVKVIAAGKQLLVTFQPANPAAIVAGTYDATIKLWARTLAQLGTPRAVLRFAHEMNGAWYPYGSGYGAANYVALWNYVRNIWQTEETRVGAAHIPWMWCPNVDSGALPFNSYYPGNSACEIVGLDGYSTAANGWQSFSTIHDSSLTTLEALSNKPIIIGETGCGNGHPNRPSWISGMFTYLKTRPRVKGLMFWHHDNESPFVGYMLRDAASAEAYRAGLADWAPGVT